jgi:hypothetical protein
MYSPVYKSIVGTYTDQHVAFELFVPESVKTPMCAAAARVYALLPEDYADNLLLTVVLWHS